MMSNLNLSAIATRIGAVYHGPAVPVSGVSIDSRRIAPGDVFVAISGTRVDGHDFLAMAAERGAVAAIVERELSAELPTLRVENTLAALTEIGRANCAASDATVVAITGSCGKTSVKNMCDAVFSQRGPTVATAGNYNNEIGVPLTLARLEDDTRFAIVEMGATGRGDVAHLCTLAKPSITTVLNAMEAHLDGFGGVADVADIKAEIFDALDEGKVAVLSLDGPWSELWRERIAATGARVITWSTTTAADVTATDVEEQGLAGTTFVLNLGGQQRRIHLPCPGLHNVANALAAAALGLAAGLELNVIARGLEQTVSETGRLQTERLADGTALIDDSYNANPGSVRAAIDLLAKLPGLRTLMLGEMLELGEESAAMHAAMGHLARERGLETFVGVGTALAPAVDAFGEGGQLFSDRSAVVPALGELLANSDTVLVKGSRGAAMESLLDDLRRIGNGSPSQPAEVEPC